MRRNILFAGLIMLATAVTGTAQTPAAKPPPVAVVIVLQPPDGSPATFAKLTASLAKARTIAAKLGNPGKARLYAPSFGGTDVNTCVIVVEYPSLLAMAEAEPKMAASAEWQAMVGEIMGGGFKLVSQSLVTEVVY